MNYSIGAKYKDYMQLSNEKINFHDDTLYFERVDEAYKYIYYGKDNKFQIKFNYNLRSNIRLLRLILNHCKDVEIIYDNAALHHKIRFLYTEKRLRKNRKLTNFKPPVKILEGENGILYAVDNYIVNNQTYDYTGINTNAVKSLESLKFNYVIASREDRQNYEIVDEKIEVGVNAEEIEYSILDKTIHRTKFKPAMYAYKLEEETNYLILSVLLQGYTRVNKSKFLIEKIFDDNTTEIVDYQILDNDDWKYYSRHAHLVKDNFIKIKIPRNDSEKYKFKFLYKDRRVKVYSTRFLTRNTINGNYAYNVNKNVMYIDRNAKRFKDKKYQKYEKLQAKNKQEIYLFQDRSDRADDNAEKMYEYYMNNTDKEIYFVIDFNCKCYERLKSKGFNLIDYQSKKHKEIYLKAKVIISSHAARRVYDPFYPQKQYINLEKFKFVFLQHGIIMDKHVGFLDKLNNKIDLFITSTPDEKNLVEDFSGFTNVKCTGLARFDNYNETIVSEKVVYAPSWNTIYKDNLKDSVYIKEIENVINSEKIHEILKRANLKLELLLHPEVINENIKIKNNYNVTILKPENFLYSQKLKEAKILITDYSSLFFDVLYQKRRVIFHQPYQLHHENKYNDGYKDSIKFCKTMYNLEKILEQEYETNFKITDQEKRNIESYFAYIDNNNAQRIFEEIEKLTNNVTRK